ncbi:beta-Casp domain-containing protein [Ditylenchus destructor]|uniref:Integrator complex subunit 11 n=1 Tax=Ditylenchus destructor TaxID=166010 RepID=A0AAD4MYM1_9BILA|nr:beta-Casp domain-containing protein [Ditylenchus destructor]
MPQIRAVPLGAGCDVGRSCILIYMGGKRIMLDCGMHMGFSDEKRFPDFSYISGGGPLDDHLDAVIISHFHLDHCGALPHMSEIVGYSGPIYMTYPSKAIVPVLLEDYRKVQTEFRGETNFFTKEHIKACMKKVEAVNLHEIVHVDKDFSIQAFYAGHVLGAAMFLIRVGSESVLYTGDFNMTPDRHLGAARVPPGLNPNLLITETTYADTIRDSKRARERDFLKKIHDTINTGGKVLIPVFALGRAQELCILLESYWERLDLHVPIYFSQGLAEKATKYYRLFINWTNEKIKKTFVQRNMFEFKHILPFDMSYADAPGPMVLFSTPGMLHGGQSLRVFKKWCGDEKNMIIMPGYCVAGTIGAKVINGAKKVEIEGRSYDVNIRVEYMSFSAHADAKGIMQLIRNVNPGNVMFVHGEERKMEFLKSRVEKEFKIPVYKPANGESIVLNTNAAVYVNISDDFVKKCIRNCPSPSKRHCPFNGFVSLNKETNELDLLTAKEAADMLGTDVFTITYSENYEVDSLDWEHVAKLFTSYDPELQVKTDGISMFDGDVLLMRVADNANQFELVWEENRDHWLEILTNALRARKVEAAILKQKSTTPAEYL